MIKLRLQWGKGRTQVAHIRGVEVDEWKGEEVLQRLFTKVIDYCFIAGRRDLEGSTGADGK